MFWYIDPLKPLKAMCCQSALLIIVVRLKLTFEYPVYPTRNHNKPSETHLNLIKYMSSMLPRICHIRFMVICIRVIKGITGFMETPLNRLTYAFRHAILDKDQANKQRKGVRQEAMQHRERYPKNWNQLALACKIKANWTCEGCHTYIGPQGVKRISRKGKDWFMYLCAAHVNHDPENPNPELKALCLYCHAAYDFDAKQIERRIQAEQKRHAVLIAKAGYVPAKTRLKNIERYKRKEKVTA